MKTGGVLLRSCVRGAVMVAIAGLFCLAAGLNCPAKEVAPPQDSPQDVDVQKIISESGYKPAPRGNDPWVGRAIQRHAQNVEVAAKDDVDIVFLGDSITDGWIEHNKKGKGIAVWHEYYDGYRVANFGIGADGIQHVLWRLINGELGGKLSPKIFIINIGTNNIWDDTTKVASGVTAIVKLIRYRFPDCRVLLLGIFPRDAKPSGIRDKIKAVNAILARLDDGKMVRFLDIGAKFLDDKNNIPANIMPDALHPGPDGYKIWADAMAPLLGEMMKETGIKREKAEIVLPKAVPVPQGQITVDGDAADWKGIPPMSLPYMKKDAGSISLCWSDAGLFGLARVQDANVKVNPQTPWGGDCVELWLEKDCARSWDNSLASAQYVICPLPDKGAGPGHVMIPYGAAEDKPDKVQCAWKPAADGYVMEFLIPAELLKPAKLEAGTKIGMNFCLSDDGKPVEQFFTDKNKDESYWTPSTWGVVELKKQ